MIEQLLEGAATAAPPAHLLEVEPFLHFGPDAIYNVLTDQTLRAGDAGFRELQSLRHGLLPAVALEPSTRDALYSTGWLVESAPDLSARFRLKYISLEASTVCNQACYFCPVSVDRRQDHHMSMELYERICAQLAEYRDTIEGVSMIHYNEPTADKRFLEQVAMLKRYGLPPAVLTNATGLTPKRVDAILEMGGLKYLSINLSTLDRERYKKDRGGDHLPIVLRHLDYVKDKPLAPTMDMAVLGSGGDLHKQDYEAIKAHFAGSRFNVQYYEVMDRAGAVQVGLHPLGRHKKLCGCEQTGSRPVQWLHVNPMGQAVLCCQDYHDRYVVGDLNTETIAEVLGGPRMAMMRRWVYGIEEGPKDFICRQCIYALTAEAPVLVK